MIFNSLTYLSFLGAVVVLYWFLPRASRLWMLFIGSLMFYGFWRVDFIPLLLISTATDYVAARIIHASADPQRRRIALFVSLTVNLGLLGFFKYTLFAVGTVNGLASWLGWAPHGGFSIPLHIILPLGISFYTFQSISYTLDVYRGFIAPLRSFVLFATYVVFFPQLVAGPILRAGEVVWQLDKRPRFDRGDIAFGLRRILSGLFLKCVLADPIAGLVDKGFAQPVAMLAGFDVWTLAFLFGFQIYFDFAGYSHIAIGSARLMGIRFPENFNFPYLATSPRDFWRRWHISLSSWIRDYLYLPLCGAQVRDESVGGLDLATEPRITTMRRYRALWITWALMGLWHGANWTFVVWGLWHAAMVTGQRLIGVLLPLRIPAFVGWAVTLPLMQLGWIPFRAQSLSDAMTLLATALTPSAYLRPLDAGAAPGLLASLGFNLHRDTYYAAAATMLLVILAWVVRQWIVPRLQDAPRALMATEAIVYACAVPLVYVFLRPVNQFIYFQF